MTILIMKSILKHINLFNLCTEYFIFFAEGLKSKIKYSRNLKINEHI